MTEISPKISNSKDVEGISGEISLKQELKDDRTILEFKLHYFIRAELFHQGKINTKAKTLCRGFTVRDLKTLNIHEELSCAVVLRASIEVYSSVRGQVSDS